MINAVEIERDECGFWTHPDLPYWDESTPISEINAFLKESNLEVKAVFFDGDAPDELTEKYFEGCECEELANWQPTKPGDNAFLLSIHDTEDGPVAVWALPIEVESNGK